MKLEELRNAIAKVTADPKAFTNIAEAYKREDIGKVRGILRELDVNPAYCEAICLCICWMVCYCRCTGFCGRPVK